MQIPFPVLKEGTHPEEQEYLEVTDISFEVSFKNSEVEICDEEDVMILAREILITRGIPKELLDFSGTNTDTHEDRITFVFSPFDLEKTAPSRS